MSVLRRRAIFSSPLTTWKLGIAVAVVVLLSGQAARPATPCGDPGIDPGAARETMRALASGRDVWGEELLASRDGPTYDGARRHLGPLLYARAPGRTALTESGVYYVPIADPPGANGAAWVALHVADGSQIIRRRVGAESLTIRVGDERYGSCLGRLTPATLRDGWLPILETAYADARGTKYQQESFTTGRRSFVALTASGGATAVFGTMRMNLPAYVAWDGGTPRDVARDAYVAARATFERRWRARLARAVQIDVPEQVVMDARRALLVQDLLLGWRYSIGNAYEEFSYPESPDVAQVLGEQGFPDVERAILLTSLTRRGTPFPNWKRGERLLVSAAHVRRSGDRGYLARATPTLRGFVAALDNDLGDRGLLGRERFSADIPDLVYAFHGQVVAWAGLRAIADVWAQNGYRGDAAKARGAAARLGRALRDAVRRSQRRLPDGSLFIPARLLDGEKPYGSLVEARSGSYWNLVMPFAFSTRFLAPADSRGVLRYMLLHGSRLLGLVRAGAYALYGRDAPFPVSGTDEVYGVNVARFLADTGEADQLVLSLYGGLAAALTPGTFVAGEGASVAPIDGKLYRSMYLPPNGASNAAFLETLRTMLVHETPNGLELASATPRGWLRPGGRIAVRGAPTAFGRVSYTIAVDGKVARVHVDPPPRGRLVLRLRLPSGDRTLNLSGAHRPLDREVRYAPS
jgi:hypothetical protein